MFYGDYTDCPQTALFPFGHGLSYTTFEHKDLAVTASDTRSPIAASVVVANTGPRDRGGGRPALRDGPGRLGGTAGDPVARLRPGGPGAPGREAGHLPHRPEPPRFLPRGHGLRRRAGRVPLRHRVVHGQPAHQLHRGTRRPQCSLLAAIRRGRQLHCRRSSRRGISRPELPHGPPARRVRVQSFAVDPTKGGSLRHWRQTPGRLPGRRGRSSSGEVSSRWPTRCRGRRSATARCRRRRWHGSRL